MGTLCDWQCSILPLLTTSPRIPNLNLDLNKLATDWRAGFFLEIHARFKAGLENEDVDVTHLSVLDRLLEERGVDMDVWGEDVRERLVGGWHFQPGWRDVGPALERLRGEFFLVVLANGTTRLQLDIVKSADLPFRAIFSSQLLGLTKPDPEIYIKTLDLMQLKPEECIMVAAHAYDLRAAKKVGMNTVYIQRSTEDSEEDMKAVREDVDLFIDGMKGDDKCGLGELADILLA